MNMLQRYEIDNNFIYENYYKMNDENQQEIFSIIYNYIKSITRYYCKGQKMEIHYKYLKKDLLYIEKQTKKIKIINSQINTHAKNFIEDMILQSRNYLLKEYQILNKHANLTKQPKNSHIFYK